MKRKLRVGILFGGKSGEHEVSIASAHSTLEALDKAKYEAVLIGIDKQGRWLAGTDAIKQLTGGATELPGLETQGIRPGSGAKSEAVESGITAGLPAPIAARSLIRESSPLGSVDVVLPILHGPMGEDGTVQGLLELADIPYAGAGVAASAVGMDKELLKTLLRAHGLPVVDFRIVRRTEWQRNPAGVLECIESALPYPVFVKPVNMGSSVGINKVTSRHELGEAITYAGTFDRKIIIEQGINAREVECSVLGNDQPVVSVVGEVRTRHRQFYDYIAKYTDGEADLIIPAEISPEQSDEVRSLARQAFLAIDCAGMARADFFIDRDSSKVYINELNTIPGFTRFSMYPKLWHASGLSYPELIDQLVQLALERYADKKRSGL
jgi:D-alanine-D-alanine ligase